jgi:hypothetical protein
MVREDQALPEAGFLAGARLAATFLAGTFLADARLAAAGTTTLVTAVFVATDGRLALGLAALSPDFTVSGALRRVECRLAGGSARGGLRGRLGRGLSSRLFRGRRTAAGRAGRSLLLCRHFGLDQRPGGAEFQAHWLFTPNFFQVVVLGGWPVA